MKKINKKENAKRALSMFLALTMCSGMISTTAFAGEDDVYTYVNVSESKEDPKPAPKFEDKGGSEAKEKLNEAKEKLDSAKENVDKSEAGSTAKEKVESAVKELSDTKMPEHSSNSETSTDSGSSAGSETSTDSEDTASSDTSGDTASADTSEDTASSDTSGDTASSDTSGNTTSADSSRDTASADTSGDTANSETPASSDISAGPGAPETPAEDPSSFSADVNDIVGELNKTVADTMEAVNAGTSGAAAVIEGLKENEQAAQKELQELNDARQTAEKAVAEANQRLAEEKAKLDAELADQIGALAPVSAEPVLDSFGTYEEYADAYTTWVTACNDYNTKVAELEQTYKAQLDNLTKSITTDAQAALKSANTALENFTAAQQSYANALEQNKDALDSYNDALNKEDVNNYNAAVDNYNTAADQYNEVLAQDKEYSEALGGYNEAVEKYNTEVDSFNKTAGTWNDGHESDKIMNGLVSDANSDAEAEALADEASKVTMEDITVYREVTNALKSEFGDPWAGLTDEEYNAKVDSYNKVVQAYNEKVDAYNKPGQNGEPSQAMKDLLGEVEKYFPGQTAHSQNDNYWFTVGKIKIKGIFGSSADKDSPYYVKYLLSEVDEKDYVAPDGDAKDVYDDDNRYIYRGRDILYFDKSENGDYTLTYSKNVINEDNEGKKVDNSDNIYAEGKDKGEVDLKNALGDVKNFTRYDESAGPNDNSSFDPHKNIYKWVLKVSYGADDYEGETMGEGAPTEKQVFHLDGYLYAQKLSQLAMLEKRAIKEKTLDMANGFTTSELAPVTDDNSDWNAQIKVVDPIVVTKIEPGSPVSKPEPTTPDNSGNEDDDTTPDNSSNEDDDTTPGHSSREDDSTTPTVVRTRTSDGGSENVALTETVQIVEGGVPLTEAFILPAREVASTDAIEILEGAVPLAGGVTISDEEVPLANVPRTGDISAIWYAVAMMCACGLFGLFLRKEEDVA